MRRVVVESPFRDWAEARMYLDRCLRHSLSLNEAPFASHQMYTDALDDTKAEERAAGMEAGFAWFEAAEAVIFYVDWGMSAGMMVGLNRAIILGKPIEFRYIGRAS